jgi:hypothetical protein
LETDKTWTFTGKVCEGCRADAIGMHGDVAAYGNLFLGTVTVVRRKQPGQEWIQESVLESSQATPDDFFGYVVAVSSEITDIVVTGSSFRSSKANGFYSGVSQRRISSIFQIFKYSHHRRVHNFRKQWWAVERDCGYNPIKCCRLFILWKHRRHFWWHHRCFV